MRRALIAATVGSAVLAAAVLAGAEVGDDRRTELVAMLDDSCVACHGPGLAGGMAGALTPAALKGKDPAALAQAILNGVPGTMMPAFSSALNAEEAAWLAGRLQAGPAAP